MDGVRNKKKRWGRTALRLHYEAEKGFVQTSQGTKVEAYRLLDSTLKMDLYNLDTLSTVSRSVEFYNQFKFDISYNCFGYCFAESKVFLPDPTSFIIDDYEVTNSEDAEIILFKKFDGFNDKGGELYSNSHAVKVLENGNVSFKPGINELIENVAREKAIHTYNYNHEVYIKKKY